MHIEEYQLDDTVALKNLNPMDKWILSKLNHLVVDVTENLEKYNFADARNSIQAFIWHDFCDEYIEAVKYRLYTDLEDLKESKDAAKYTLKTVISTSLKTIITYNTSFYGGSLSLP